MSRFSFPKSLAALGMVALMALVGVGCSQDGTSPIVPQEKTPAVVQSKTDSQGSILGAAQSRVLSPDELAKAAPFRNSELAKAYVEALLKELRSGKSLEQIVKERSKNLAVSPKKGSGGASIQSYPTIGNTAMSYLGGYNIPDPSNYNSATPWLTVQGAASYGIYSYNTNNLETTSGCITQSALTQQLGATGMVVLHEVYCGGVRICISSNNVPILGGSGQVTGMGNTLPDGYSGQTCTFYATYLPTKGGAYIEGAFGSLWTSNGAFQLTLP